MTKQEFMYRLAQQLLSLPPEERVCALTFYDEYFADAGEENVQQVIQELGSPEEVARTIKEDFAQRNPGYDPNSPQQPYRPGPPDQPGGILAAVVFGILAMVVGLLAGGVGCLWAAATAAVLSPGLRLLGIGGGLLILGVGLLALALCVWLAANVLPGLFRGFVELCRKPFHRKGGAQ